MVEGFYADKQSGVLYMRKRIVLGILISFFLFSIGIGTTAFFYCKNEQRFLWKQPEVTAPAC